MLSLCWFPCAPRVAAWRCSLQSNVATFRWLWRLLPRQSSKSWPLQRYFALIYTFNLSYVNWTSVFVFVMMQYIQNSKCDSTETVKSLYADWYLIVFMAQSGMTHSTYM